MSTCDLKVTLQTTPALTVKNQIGECCTIDSMNDVDHTESSANGTILVWDPTYNLYVRRFLDASHIINLANTVAGSYLQLSGGTLTGDLTAPNVHITNNLTVDGDIILKGSTLTIGDGGDVINLNATVNNHFVSTTNKTFDLGSSSNYWNNLYINNSYVDDSLTVNKNFVVGGNTVFTGDVITFGDSSTVINWNGTVNNNIYPTTTNVYDLGSSSYRWSTIYSRDLNVSRNLTVDGDIFLRGSTLTFGDGGDVINIAATVNSHFIPTSTNLYDLGSLTRYWRTLYANNIVTSGSFSVGNTVSIVDDVCWFPPETRIDVSGVINLDDTATVNNHVVSTTGSTYDLGTDSVRWRRVYSDYYYGDGSNLTGITAYANSVTMGTNCDAVGTGAVTNITESTKVCEALAYINQALFNVQQSTFIRSVDFTGSPLTGGAGTTVTLSTTLVGEADRLNINWGDGSWTNATSDFTPSHTYTSNENSPYTVTVYAYNDGAVGAGSNTSLSRSEYITIYTADPAVDFAIYNQLTGGSELTTYEANTGQAIYLENTTANIGNNSTTATFSINWGDDTLQQIASKVDAGGPQGARLPHTYTLDSGSGRFLITANVKSTSTATPGIFPISNTAYIKVFNTSIAAPDDLTDKTITWATSSSGNSPALAVGFTENASGKSAGDSISSSFPRVTSGSVTSSAMSSFFHTTGSVTQQVNDTTAGSPTIDSSSVDFYNYGSDGTDVTANERIYAQGLYETGTKARINYNAAGGSVGVNKAELVTNEGNSNELFYVYDDVTSAPTVDVSSATVTHGSGSYNYISGIPYYSSGGTITISGVSVSDLTGQTYYNGNAISVGEEATGGGGSGTVIATQNYSYETVLGSDYRTGNIPNADLSTTLNDLTVTLSSGDKEVYPTVTARNVNGSDTETLTSFPISVFNGTDFLDEGAIPVSDSLGLIYDTDGVRISGFTGATPSFSSSTDYYTDNAWSGAETVAGTDEAIIRYGSLGHDVTDYSGYFPIGPDLSSGRTGTQYFRFAFQRAAMSIFRLRMTGRVSGFYIAAPGTTIDTASTLNGWLDASLQYAGSGVPGASIAGGGNGSNGCAYLGSDRIIDGTDYDNETFDITLGTESSTNAYEDQILVTIALNSDDSITALSIEAAS